MAKYILAIDQSTAGTKAILFDKAGEIVCRQDVTHRQIVDSQGWVEHDPAQIFSNLLQAVKQLMNQSGIDPGQVAGVGLSNQRETAIAWNKSTGEPIYNAIVWQCARGEDICKGILDSGAGKMIQQATGIPVSPYYSAAKICWILENIPQAKELARKNLLCCSTMDSWLVYQLCGGKPKTDYSNASRTQMYHIEKLEWDQDVCAQFGISTSWLPEVCDSNSLFGTTDIGGILPKPVPVHGVLGDSHGALYGQGCLTAGMVKATYGTGSSIMMNIGETPRWSDTGIVTSLAWGMSGRVEYVLEGNINYTGAVIRWLVEDMQLLESSALAGAVAAKAAAVKGLYLVPAFSGLGAPYWKGDARGVICGMNRETKRAEIVRAAEECIGYQIADILFLMEKEIGRRVEKLRVDGGPTKDSFLMQFQADITGAQVHLPNIEELSASGPAYAAGIALGIYDTEVFNRKPKKIYEPRLPVTERDALYRGWQNAVEKSF